MNARFIGLLIATCLLVIGWMAVEYLIEQGEKAQLKDLMSYPLYAYVDDSTKVDDMQKELKRFPEIDSLWVETGAQAGRELVETYSLPVSDEMLASYTFPDLITIMLKPIHASRYAKSSIISTLRQFIPEEDIDSQSIAWANSEAKLKTLVTRKYFTNSLIAILFILAFIFSRIAFELRMLLLQKRKQVSVVDYLRYKAQTRNHMILSFALPIVLSIGGYYILVWQNVLEAFIPYWFMGALSGVLLASAIITNIIMHLMDHDNRYHEGEVIVATHSDAPLIDTPSMPSSEPEQTDEP